MGTLEDYVRAFSSSSSQVKYMDDRTRAPPFPSGLVSDLPKEVLKEYPKNQPTSIRLAWEANETVQNLSSMDTQTRTTASKGRNNQAPSTVDRETSFHDERRQASRFVGRRRLTNTPGPMILLWAKLAILLKIACSPTPNADHQ